MRISHFFQARTCDSLSPMSSQNKARPCLFLDRDGVIIKNVPYSKDPSQVELMLGIGELIRKAKALNFLVIVVTNQSGIGRGWLTLQDYQNMTDRMLELLRVENAVPDKIYFAPYYEKSTMPEFLKNSHWRKPGIGMFQEAIKDFQIDLNRSVMVGDRASDLEAAEKAGVARKYLLHSVDHEKERGLMPSSIQYQFVESLSEIQL
jgi:D,D-heptose 1,7-bisphosphate phosphatase